MLFGTSYAPQAEIYFTFHFLFYLVRQCREEVHVGNVFQFIYSESVGHKRIVGSFVRKQKCYCIHFAIIVLHQDFEEKIWNCHLVVANALVIVGYYRSANDIDRTFFQCKLSHMLFQVFPDATVKFLILWAYIGKVERFFHCCLRPFHVCRGSHVSSVPAGISVIIGSGG